VTLDCDTRDRTVAGADAVRRETIVGRDPAAWRTLRCPGCGNRPETMLVADE